MQTEAFRRLYGYKGMFASALLLIIGTVLFSKFFVIFAKKGVVY